MRKFGLLVTVAAMIFASFSCENLEEQLKPSDKETSYTFTTKIREATRMADNHFEKGDAIGVYAYTDAEMTQACDENVLYIYDGAEFASIDAIEYVTGTELAFKAVYPVQLSGKEQFDFQIQTDQSNALNYSISDLMLSEVALTDSKSPELVFDHKLAAVNLTFDSSVSMTDAEVLVYAQSSVACDIAAGSFVGQGSVEQITPAQYGSNVYRVIVAPQSVAAGEVFALVSIGGEEHKLTLDSELVLKSGYEYTYTGKINETGDLVFSSQINPWGDGGSIDGTLVGDDLNPEAHEAQFSFEYSVDVDGYSYDVSFQNVLGCGAAIVAVEEFSEELVPELYNYVPYYGVNGKGNISFYSSTDYKGATLDEGVRYYVVAFGANYYGYWAYNYEALPMLGEPEEEDSFMIRLTDLSYNKATVYVEPADSVGNYHIGCIGVGQLYDENGGDLQAYVEDGIASLVESGYDFSVVDNDIVYNGITKDDPLLNLAERTEYFVYAVDVNSEGELTSEITSVLFVTPEMPDTGNFFVVNVTSIGEDSAHIEAIPATKDGKLDYDAYYAVACYSKPAGTEESWEYLMGEGKLSFAQSILTTAADNGEALSQGIYSRVIGFKPDTEFIFVVVASDANYNINSRNVAFMSFTTLPEGTVRDDLPENYEFPAEPTWKGQLEFFDMNELNDGAFGYEVPSVNALPSSYNFPYVLTYMPKAEFESMTESEVCASWMQDTWDYYCGESGLQEYYSFNVALAQKLSCGLYSHLDIYEEGVDLGEVKVVLFGMDNVTMQPTTAMTVVDFDCANPNYTVLTKAASPFDISRVGVPNVLQASIDNAKSFRSAELAPREMTVGDLSEVLRKSGVRPIRK